MISFMKRRKGIIETNHVPCLTTAMNSGVVVYSGSLEAPAESRHL
jgi:hypothetical protein